MVPLIVTARTPAGFAASDDWSPTLDGILAYWTMRERLGEERFALDASEQAALAPVEGLPLAVERWGDLWWYACSAPSCEPLARHRKFYHRRFDDAAADGRLDPAVRKVNDAAGPYKAARLHETIRVAPSLSWHVVGDAAEIRRLLSRCTHIGRGTSRGQGLVAEWIVAEGGDEQVARLRRPLPAGYAREHGIDGPTMPWAIRPPAKALGNIVECVMP